MAGRGETPVFARRTQTKQKSLRKWAHCSFCSVPSINTFLMRSIHPSIQSASFKCLSKFGLQGQSKQRFSLSLGISSSSSTQTTSTKFMVSIFSFKSYQLQNDFDFVNHSPIEVKVCVYIKMYKNDLGQSDLMNVKFSNRWWVLKCSA